MPLSLARNLLGVAILIAMAIGGGTPAGLLSDDVVSLALTFASLFAIIANRRSVLTPFYLLFPLAALALCALQMMPLPIDMVRRFWAPAIQEAWAAAGSPSSYGVLTISVGATLHMLAQTAVAVLFFWACLNVDSAESPKLVNFFVIGWLINLLAGVIQSVVMNFDPTEIGLSYEIVGGTFANINHFGLFMAIGLPPLILFAIKQKSQLSAILVPLILLMLLATGSRSAIGIAVLLLILGLFAAGASRRTIVVAIAVLGLALGILGTTGFLSAIALKDFDAPVARPQIYATVWTAIKNNPIFGSGFGTFLMIYPLYENTATLTPEYANRAHNDFLELVVEGGIPAALMIAAYFVFLARMFIKLRRLPLSPIRDTGMMALLAIIGILAQSVVDYPLRTWIILSVFIYCNTILIDAVLHRDLAQQARAASRKRRRRRTRSANLDSPAPVLPSPRLIAG